MAKEANFNVIGQTLQEAQQNKELLEALTTSLKRYITGQKSGLAELENLMEQACSSKLTIKKRGGYRGRRKKE